MHEPQEDVYNCPFVDGEAAVILCNSPLQNLFLKLLKTNHTIKNCLYLKLLLCNKMIVRVGTGSVVWQELIYG